ncbi:MAG: RrF2 family transcriptional regulator, partial [Nocardioidaceae bacterium]
MRCPVSSSRSSFPTRSRRQPRFLEQLFVALRRADLVTAVRGAHGGFILSRDPKDITTLQIVEA